MNFIKSDFFLDWKVFYLLESNMKFSVFTIQKLILELRDNVVPPQGNDKLIVGLFNKSKEPLLSF